MAQGNTFISTAEPQFICIRHIRYKASIKLRITALSSASLPAGIAASKIATTFGPKSTTPRGGFRERHREAVHLLQTSSRIKAHRIRKVSPLLENGHLELDRGHWEAANRLFSQTVPLFHSFSLSLSVSLVHSVLNTFARHPRHKCATIASVTRFGAKVSLGKARVTQTTWTRVDAVSDVRLVLRSGYLLLLPMLHIIMIEKLVSLHSILLASPIAGAGWGCCWGGAGRKEFLRGNGTLVPAVMGRPLPVPRDFPFVWGGLLFVRVCVCFLKGASGKRGGLVCLRGK